MDQLMDNHAIIHDKIEPALRKLGLQANRERWYLGDPSHRGFSVDVGSSRGEVLLRVYDNGIQIERLPILRDAHVEDALVTVAALIAARGVPA